MAEEKHGEKDGQQFYRTKMSPEEKAALTAAQGEGRVKDAVHTEGFVTYYYGNTFSYDDGSHHDVWILWSDRLGQDFCADSYAWRFPPGARVRTVNIDPNHRCPNGKWHVTVQYGG